MRLLATYVAATLLLAACSGAGSDLLPDSPGQGLPGKVRTEQELDLSLAGGALPGDHSAIAQKLGSLQLKSGFARVWGTGTDFVTMTDLEFPAADKASAFVDFEQRVLAGGKNTFTTPHRDIPGSFTFVISSLTPSSGNQDPELCNGVWFAYRTHAFQSLACGARPSWATQIELAAKGLYDRARARLG